VAAFIIESYKQLSSDSGATTVLLLKQISQQLSSLSTTTQVSSPTPYRDSSFRPSPSAIRINILWFLSLTLSLICALAATLMQQWARRYLQQVQEQTTPYKRALTREYLFQGVEAFRLSQAVEAVPALLHVAVFLFFVGLVDFLFSVDSTVGHVILGVMCFFGGIYIFLTFLPNIRPNCPYRTPFSRDSLKWFLVSMIVVSTAPALLVIPCLRHVIPSDKFEMLPKRLWRFVESFRSTISDVIESPQEEIDRRALQWAVETIDDDDDIETLIEGIPGFLKAGTSKNPLPIVEELLDPKQDNRKPLGYHINRLIQTCTADGYHGANEMLRRRRALICLDTVRSLTKVHSAPFSYEMFGDKTWPSIHSLKRDKDPAIAINAISTGAMAACGYLRFVFKSRTHAPNEAPNLTHMDMGKLRQLVNAPWHEADLTSFFGCYLLIIQGFVSSLQPYLKSDKGISPTFHQFHVVWETLPRILSMAPLTHSNPRSKELFLTLWAQLENLARIEHVTDNVDDVPPIVQLMSLLRPTFESIQVKQDRVKKLRTAVTVARVARTRAPP
jgi:hypothetical protein